MSDLSAQVLAGDIRAIARAATLIENQTAESMRLLRELSPHTGHALVIGVTGPPGVGKSTLCDQLIRVLREQGKTVGVIAVDPSSPVTGGALLGDRIRMQQHHADPGVFIRSMASRGIPGGLARATYGTITLLDAAGRDVIIVETVGVGQAEVEIAKQAYVTILVLAPGSGDDVQAMKSGVMEVAGIFVINKADLPGAEKLRQELAAEGHQRPVLLAVASEGWGISEVTEAALAQSRAPLLHRQATAEIDHIGIAVPSIDKALDFWLKQLGLTMSSRETVIQEKVNVAMLPVGGPRAELLEPAAPDSAIAKFIEKRGPGIHHIALRVPDLQSAVDRLQTAGARILNDPQRGAGGHLYVFVHPSSTGGVLLELIQA